MGRGMRHGQLESLSRRFLTRLPAHSILERLGKLLGMPITYTYALPRILGEGRRSRHGDGCRPLRSRAITHWFRKLSKLVSQMGSRLWITSPNCPSSVHSRSPPGQIGVFGQLTGFGP